ncbi:hypothetical protein HY065_03055 [Candidatus Berkelbacteria bacterium]|nr:hypothetical protein [Candidatus Berkelbacteria bacterium]
MHNIEIHNKASQLRLKGKTYQEIGRSLGVAKSTLHYWLQFLPIPENSRPAARKAYFLERVQRLGAAANHQKKLAMLERLQRKQTRMFD